MSEHSQNPFCCSITRGARKITESIVPYSVLLTLPLTLLLNRSLLDCFCPASGTIALREMCHYQQSTDPLIGKLPFQCLAPTHLLSHVPKVCQALSFTLPSFVQPILTKGQPAANIMPLRPDKTQQWDLRRASEAGLSLSFNVSCGKQYIEDPMSSKGRATRAGQFDTGIPKGLCVSR